MAILKRHSKLYKESEIAKETTYLQDVLDSGNNCLKGRVYLEKIHGNSLKLCKDGFFVQ